MEKHDVGLRQIQAKHVHSKDQTIITTYSFANCSDFFISGLVTFLLSKNDNDWFSQSFCLNRLYKHKFPNFMPSTAEICQTTNEM